MVVELQVNLAHILCGVHAGRLNVEDAGYFWPARPCSETTPTILGDLRASARISARTIARARWVVPRATRAEGRRSCAHAIA